MNSIETIHAGFNGFFIPAYAPSLSRAHLAVQDAATCLQGCHGERAGVAMTHLGGAALPLSSFLRALKVI